MLAAGGQTGINAWGETRSYCRAGFSAAGRSSANPATARKAEKKKRGEAARTLANSSAAAGNSFDDLCAGLQHEPVYTGGVPKTQASGCMKLRQLFQRFIKAKS
jgi:hypothetical protein